VDNLEKVLEKLAISEKTTIVVAREIDGKIRVTSGSWEGEKVFASSIWARAWLLLAEQAEKNSETFVVYEAPTPSREA
jgi:hypothetical protein